MVPFSEVVNVTLCKGLDRSLLNNQHDNIRTLCFYKMIILFN